MRVEESKCYSLFSKEAQKALSSKYAGADIILDLSMECSSRERKLTTFSYHPQNDMVRFVGVYLYYNASPEHVESTIDQYGKSFRLGLNPCLRDIMHHPFICEEPVQTVLDSWMMSKGYLPTGYFEWVLSEDLEE